MPLQTMKEFIMDLAITEQYINAGVNAFSQEDYHKARSLFSMAIESNSKSPMVFQYRALCNTVLLQGLSAQEYENTIGNIKSDLRTALTLTVNLMNH